MTARKHPRWTLSAGRLIEYDGVPLFNVSGHSDARGYRYQPAELDNLTRAIVDALNARRVDGSRVAR